MRWWWEGKDPRWAVLDGSNALASRAAQVLVVSLMTCFWPRRPLRAANGPEEAPPVDGRAGVAARVVADTHMALVQLHGDVVIVPVVQQDPVVLCRGDLMSKGTVSPTPSPAAAAQAGRRSTRGAPTEERCRVQNCPPLPAQVTWQPRV